MARLAKCKLCEKQLTKEERYNHASKTYCKECYEIILRDSEEYKQLITFICEQYEIERPTGFMLKQIKELKNEFGWSYAAMTYTLWYCKEVLNKELNEIYGISLVKYYYEEAKEYYSQQEKLMNQMKKLKDVELKTKVIKKSKAVERNSNSSLIDINTLLKGGDIN